MPFQRADMGPRVRIEQQLVRVEAMTRVRLEGAIDPKAVEGAGSDVGDAPMKNLVGEFRQFEAFALALAVAVENADLDLGRMRRKNRKIGPLAIPGRPEWKRPAFAEAR